MFLISKNEKIKQIKERKEEALKKVDGLKSRHPEIFEDFILDSFIPENDFQFFKDRVYNTETKAWTLKDEAIGSDDIKTHVNTLVGLHATMAMYVNSARLCIKKLKEFNV
jgi:hypothetical protein